MKNTNIQLETGDEIGFVLLANDIDSNDKIIYCKIVEVTTRDGDRGFCYMFPDGEISSAAICEKDVKYYRITRETPLKTENAPHSDCAERRRNRIDDGDLPF